MGQPLSEHERHQLLSAWCDGSISDAQLEQLDLALRADPGFRKFYLAYMDQHAVLAAGLLAIGDPLLPVQHLGLVDRLLGPGESGLAKALADQDGRDSAPRRTRPVFSRRLWVAAAVVSAAAALLLIGLTAGLGLTGRRVAPVVSAQAPADASGRLARADGFAVVIQLLRAEWEDGNGPKPFQGDILPACRLALRSGQVTLGFLSGVTLTVAGPADLDLLAIDRVHCRRGKLRTRVPEGAEGFVVSSPGSAVVDRGTEFGLNVADDGKAQVMVFEGEAEAVVLSPSGSPLRSQEIFERHAFDIDPQRGQIEEAAVRLEDFVLPPVMDVPPLELDRTYREAVLEARPWAYWRFDTMDKGGVACEISGGPALRAAGPVHLAIAAASNWCAEFGSDASEQSLAMDGLWEPPRDPGYAVELWVLSERIGHAALASLIDPGEPSDDYKHLSLIELTASDRQSLFPPGGVRFLHRWPVGDSGGDNLFSSKHYIPYRWHHLVAQRTGGRMELYMDGVPNQPVALRPDVATEACRFLVGRLKPVPRRPGQVHSRPFVGRIDELALYNRPLSALEIARHYKLGAPASGTPEP
jgi:hypothetical protein